jgi:hypothetical protein
LTWSEGFSNAAWVDSFGSITLNVATSPDGTTNAASYKDNNTGGTGEVRIYNEINVDAASTYTFSIFIKSSGLSQWALLQATDFDGALDGFAYFDIVNGVVGVSTNLSSTKIENYGNGWYRCSITWTQGATDTLVRSQFQIVAGNNNKNVTRNGTNGYYVWGAQTEKGAYPTSYIPTTSASATRVADVAIKSSISSLFGASATSLFMDFEITQASSGGNWTVTGWDGTNLFSLCQFDASNNFPRIVFDGGVDINVGSALSIGRHKIAVSFTTNDFRAYIDGVLVGTDTSCTYNRYDRIAVNGTAWTGNTNNNNSFKLNQYAQFPNVLTNSELASLTTI